MEHKGGSLPLLCDVNGATRLHLHLLTGVAVVFLSIYGKVVCPFIDTLSFGQVVSGLGGVFLLQVFAREWLYHRLSQPAKGITTARQGFHVSVITWVGAGAVGSLLHSMLYTDFYWSSHLKLLSGYWGLGAGILSQLEYVILEGYFRDHNHAASGGGEALERITRRLMEGFVLFTLVPAMMMVLMSFRFVYEGFTDRDAALEVLFLGSFFVLTGIFVSWLYGQALRRDCNQLLAAVLAVSKGEFQVTIDATRSDELGRVAGAINAMAQGLVLRERIREAFGRFVNPEVAETFLEKFARRGGAVKMGGERREVAILMADIRSFSPLSEGMPPEKLTELLNAYFGEMVVAIRAHGGMVDKFIGDAIMAVFGLTAGEGDFPGDAVAAAQEMRQRLADFNETRRLDGQPPIANGIGIHLGEVVAGYIGSPDRLEFTVIGHAVNLAARIEGQCKPPNPPVLFSQAVADRIGDRFAVRPVTTTALKGITGTTTLFTVEA